MFKFDLQLFGGGGKGSKQTLKHEYAPVTPEENDLKGLAVGYGKDISSIVNQMTQGAAGLLNNNYGTSNVDYGALTNNALGQIGSAQQGIGNLAQGKLPTSFTDNMTASIQSGVDKTVGSTLNSLAGNGVLNSSVTSGAMNDISKNVTDTMAQQYQNNAGLLSGLYGQQLGAATSGIQAAAGGQQAALQSPSQLLQLGSQLQNNGVNGTLGQLISSRTGAGTTTTSGGGGGGGLLTSLLGGFLGKL